MLHRLTPLLVLYILASHSTLSSAANARREALVSFLRALNLALLPLQLPKRPPFLQKNKFECEENVMTSTFMYASIAGGVTCSFLRAVSPLLRSSAL